MPISVTVNNMPRFKPPPPPPWGRYDLFTCKTTFVVRGNARPGCLVQHVERNEKTIEGVFNRKTLIASNDYWELWYVDGGGKVTPSLMGFNDRFTVGGSEYRLATQGRMLAVKSKKETAGVWKIRGTLYWFDYEGEGPPPGWNVNRVGEAGGLPSRYGKPAQGLGSPIRVRRFAGRWDFTGPKTGWANSARPFPSAHFRHQIGSVG